jgi:hypothetical protein
MHRRNGRCGARRRRTGARALPIREADGARCWVAPSERRRPSRYGLPMRAEWGSRPIGNGWRIGDCAGMCEFWSVRGRDAVEPKRSAAGRAERNASATDSVEPATRERDGVDDCGVASFPASDPPSWWSGR